MEIDLIYCGNGNRRLAEIAIAHGFQYGAQLPGTIYPDVARLKFADQDWKAPHRDKYMAALAEHKPHMATVLDWEADEQLPEVLEWAEEAAQHVEVVLIIPKVIGGIPRLPRCIAGAQVRLGYSVPTRYGGTQVPVWEFGGWPVHLLGGSPHKQMELCGYLDVRSVDGNAAQEMATNRCQFWVPGNARYARNRWWPTLREANDGELWGDGSEKTDAPYEAFERSCRNIATAWRRADEHGTVRTDLAAFAALLLSIALVGAAIWAASGWWG